MIRADTGTFSGLLQLQVVVESLPAGFETLRAEALAEGHGFIEKLAVDWMSGTTRFDREGEALLAANAHGVLAAIGGLTIDPYIPGAVRMRRFYVRPSWRRGGIGRKLVFALLDRGLGSHRSITVNASKGSISFWEVLGFEPDACDGHSHVLNADRL